ncbi:uncharacterized protein LOC100835734 [Brachypodium distachyon]|uniref:Uncharacterized protein n=1 Tax=Brachypodium distachyon TaxID=15368 RepID=A0A2K2D0K9_BRADI|nr:uncharacterized protein LOC100835734 [Brachypodium distachyon]PNT67805.1 hypothetical protein BRADI_3g32267v3 [Brachypodium distachyon]PNT67807.1 hypothetical protein BRADI_3g32267v3 [Brachypodium distachyon]|eukprot:XP_010234953.1 uncharacterized protein LOC100835734 [Brachypodium distachyon]
MGVGCSGFFGDRRCLGAAVFLFSLRYCCSFCFLALAGRVFSDEMLKKITGLEEGQVELKPEIGKLIPESLGGGGGQSSSTSTHHPFQQQQQALSPRVHALALLPHRRSRRRRRTTTLPGSPEGTVTGYCSRCGRPCTSSSLKGRSCTGELPWYELWLTLLNAHHVLDEMLELFLGPGVERDASSSCCRKALLCSGLQREAPMISPNGKHR